MNRRPPRSPRQVAEEDVIKTKQSFSLLKKNFDIIHDMARAEGIPISNLIDEAIRYYIEDVKEEYPPGKSN
jgi:hypothetical protein